MTDKPFLTKLSHTTPKPLFRRLWFRMLLVALVLIILGAGGRYGYHLLKNYQVSRLDKQAISYLREGKPKEARMSLQGALRLNPVDPVALHLEVRMEEATGENVKALASYDLLARSRQLSLSDLRPYALLAARQGEADQANRLATIASKNYPVLGHQIRADLLLLNKQPAEAAKELRTAISSTPDADSEMADPARKDLVGLLLKYGPQIPPVAFDKSTGNSAEAVALLTVLSSRTDARGPEALAMGIRAGLVPQSDLLAWITKLRTHPKVTPEMLLMADAATIQLDPKSQETIVTSMLERLNKESAKSLQDSLNDRIEAIRLLLTLKEPSRAADLISREESFQNEKLFLLWMSVQVQAGRLPAIMDALALPKNPLPAYLRDLYRAAMLKQQKEEGKSHDLFAKVLADHGPGHPECIEVLLFLNAEGEKELFDQGFNDLFKDPENSDKSKALATFGKIVAGVSRSQDSAKLLWVEELASHQPLLRTNPLVQNGLAYERLLCNQPLDKAASDGIATRLQENPHEFAIRVTRALQLMKIGSPLEAYAVLDGGEEHIDVLKMPPDQQALVAMLLYQTGESEQASKLLSIIRKDQLSHQEISLMKEVFFKAPVPAKPAAIQTAGIPKTKTKTNSSPSPAAPSEIGSGPVPSAALDPSLPALPGSK